MQQAIYVCLLAASSLTSASLGIFALFKRRNSKGAVSFVLSMLAVTIWSVAHTLEILSGDFSTKLFWANMQYFAYCFSPVTLVALCMEFTGYDTWIRSKRFIWLAVIPTITIILVWTDQLHGLVRYDMHMDYGGIFPVIAKKYGPAFYVHGIYSHLLNLTALALLVKAAFFNNAVYKKQAAALLTGVSLIVIPNILYVLGLSPSKRIDLTPAFFGPAGLIIAWSIFRYRFFDLVPIARDKIFEIMDAGAMVLDLQNRVLDINPAFENMLGLNALQVTSKYVEEVCAEFPGLLKACLDSSSVRTEFSIGGDSTKYYEAFFSPLTDNKGMLQGRLAVIYEITAKKRVQQELLKQQWKLAVIEERERMARDLHDNIGQVLGFINLQAQGIRKELVNAGVENISMKLNKLIDASQSAHAEIRRYIRDVRSSAYFEKDFITAFKAVVSSFEEQTGMNVRINIPPDFTGEELEPASRMNLLNILREAMNNVRKHAEAENLYIDFSLSQGLLNAVVEDDGKGFDAAQQNAVKSGFGLDIMRERALEAGGQIDISSAAGRGTRIELRIPLGERR
ncbi:MAG: histidine kinase N-terminal 7TM domain-containing protein [Oscillospiraceae bacterium]|jgi:PAS domain S-box-containing protein